MESPATREDVWSLLWEVGGAFGVVVTDLASRGNAQEVSLLIGAYVRDEAFHLLRQAPTPFALDHLVSMYRDGQNPFVTGPIIANHNATNGLNLMICYMGWQGRELDEEPAPHLRAFTTNAFVDRHGGNRHRVVFGEVCGTPFADVARRAGLRVINDYQAWRATRRARSPHKPMLLGIHRDEAIRKENHFLLRLFTYFPPRFHFTEPQREILLLAREGYTDNEIAGITGASAEAIKKRWVGIYERVQEVFPKLLPPSGSSGRGSEKRRALLMHLRDRPEELRPYSRTVARATR